MAHFNGGQARATPGTLRTTPGISQATLTSMPAPPWLPSAMTACPTCLPAFTEPVSALPPLSQEATAKERGIEVTTIQDRKSVPRRCWPREAGCLGADSGPLEASIWKIKDGLIPLGVFNPTDEAWQHRRRSKRTTVRATLKRECRRFTDFNSLLGVMEE